MQGERPYHARVAIEYVRALVLVAVVEAPHPDGVVTTAREEAPRGRLEGERLHPARVAFEFVRALALVAGVEAPHPDGAVLTARVEAPRGRIEGERKHAVSRATQDKRRDEARPCQMGARISGQHGDTCEARAYSRRLVCETQDVLRGAAMPHTRQPRDGATA
eukprot:CAMPEP_0113296126 /NCGR_PEP_ID=MMETSP0008_2-20120614/36833_1 /TAXON_ID=97485 /ORGANISM="Prymnesium parvum" /LENGTH=162 /DNA_ID=CAMNT_0000148919 /DNA_START=424 /DNA_END=912 /DNA_ORIENTATION=+ /assembly_acc=CAM_ASM_000153